MKLIKINGTARLQKVLTNKKTIQRWTRALLLFMNLKKRKLRH